MRWIKDENPLSTTPWYNPRGVGYLCGGARAFFFLVMSVIACAAWVRRGAASEHPEKVCVGVGVCMGVCVCVCERE